HPPAGLIEDPYDLRELLVRLVHHGRNLLSPGSFLLVSGKDFRLPFPYPLLFGEPLRGWCRFSRGGRNPGKEPGESLVETPGTGRPASRIFREGKALTPGE